MSVAVARGSARSQCPAPEHHAQFGHRSTGIGQRHGRARRHRVVLGALDDEQGRSPGEPGHRVAGSRSAELAPPRPPGRAGNPASITPADAAPLGQRPRVAPPPGQRGRRGEAGHPAHPLVARRRAASATAPPKPNPAARSPARTADLGVHERGRVLEPARGREAAGRPAETAEHRRRRPASPTPGPPARPPPRKGRATSAPAPSTEGSSGQMSRSGAVPSASHRPRRSEASRRGRPSRTTGRSRHRTGGVEAGGDRVGQIPIRWASSSRW